MLVASHIVPWADDPAARLKPENGLLLYRDYDLLFENHYFYFDERKRVKLTAKSKACSPYFQTRLQAIEGKVLVEPQKWPISDEFLRKHRDACFE